MEYLDGPFLERRAQVDQDVAATDQIEVRKGRVPGDVVAGEHAHFPNRFIDLVAALHFDEKLPQPRRRDAGQARFGIGGGARLPEGRLADVGAEHLDADLAGLLAQGLQQQHRDGVQLLAGGAAGHPDADRLPLGFARHDAGQNLGAQGVEGLRVAEKAGDVNQDVLVEGFHLGFVAAQQAQILVEVRDFFQGHPPGDAAADGGGFVLQKVHPGGGAQ